MGREVGRSKVNIAALILVIVSILVISGNQSKAAGNDEPVLTGFWVGGDDGLTQRFVNALRKAVKDSKFFKLAENAESVELKMRIPDHVFWCEGEKGLYFSGVVILTGSTDRYLGTSSKTCWESDISDCARRVLSDAQLYWKARTD